MRSWLRTIGCVIAAGVAGGTAWRIAMRIIFGSAQRALTNPSLQSSKLLNAFMLPPVPRTSHQPELLWIGLIGIGILWAIAYRVVSYSWKQSWWRKALLFWLASWLLMVPWFEFYLPWNVLLEPFPLVALELVCWAGVLLAVALTISGADRLLRKPSL
jgi:hypothetical protein